MRAAEPFALAQLTLRNRLVGTAHGRGIVEDGLPLPEDADYWRRRAAGGVAMLTVGGTVVAPESTWRRRITTEAWRPEAVPGKAARAEAIRAEGAIAACQLVHLGCRRRAPMSAPSAVGRRAAVTLIRLQLVLGDHASASAIAQYTIQPSQRSVVAEQARGHPGHRYRAVRP